jgi:signal transduction histidine kinase
MPHETVMELPASQIDALLRENHALAELNRQLRQTQDQLMQSERLASIGHLAAGVAHEINNPVGYVFSNFGTLERYLGDLFRMLHAYEQAEPLLAATPAAAALAALRSEVELDYLKEDVPALMAESREGISRVRKIVQDLKDFSHVDTRREWEWADLHRGLDSTLNIVANEIKYKAEVVRQYGSLPEVQCLASELNQVFMNLLVNAAQAMNKERGTITVRTGTEGEHVWVEVEDDGCGIPEELQCRVFDPFFTTKPVGKGTGLGLSLSYGIAQKHHGRLSLRSHPGQGSCFRMTIPIRSPEAAQ